MMSVKKLYRTNNRIIAGVCGGISKYLEVDPIIFRLLFLFLVFFGGSGLIIYIVMWILMPQENNIFADYKEVNENSPEPNAPITDSPKQPEQPIADKHILANRFAVICGGLMICFGLFFLFRHFIPFFQFEFYFPLFLIFAGFFIIVLGLNRKKNNDEN